MMANISIMYAWFSKKQRDNWNMYYREVSNNKVKKKHIYYIDYSDNIVEISEVSRDKNYIPNFDDAVYLGVMKKFYMASDTELSENTINYA